MTRSLAGEQSVYRDKDVSLYLSSCKLLTEKKGELDLIKINLEKISISCPFQDIAMVALPKQTRCLHDDYCTHYDRAQR